MDTLRTALHNGSSILLLVNARTRGRHDKSCRYLWPLCRPPRWLYLAVSHYPRVQMRLEVAREAKGKVIMGQALQRSAYFTLQLGLLPQWLPVALL